MTSWTKGLIALSLVAAASDFRATADPAAAAANAPAAVAIRVADPNVKWGPCPPFLAQGCQLAVLRGDPGKPGADAWLRVPPGYVIAAHTHTSAEHMVLVTGVLDVRYEGQPRVTLRPGDFAYGPAHAPHVGRCRSKQPCTLYIAFEEPIDAMPYAGALTLE